MKKNICFSATEYNLLLYCLLIKDFRENTIFLFDEKFCKKYDGKLDYLVIERSNLKKGWRKKFLIFFEIMKNTMIYKKLKKEIGIDRTLYIQDHILSSYLFIKNERFNLIEDGVGSYSKVGRGTQSFMQSIFIKLLHKFPIPGRSKNVKKIFLRGYLPTPEDIKDKVEIIDIFKLWNEKNSAEKEEIKKIFNFSNNTYQMLKESDSILFTQPLSEDGIITEEEKIALYRDILSKEKKKVIIKTHPREKTNYKAIFPNNVISDGCPTELYILAGVKIRKIITLFSTVVYSFLDSKIVFYGTKGNEKLLKKYGEIELDIYK